MTTVSAQHSANIIAAQWDALHERVQAFHPDESYSQTNKEFLNQFLIDGSLSMDSHFALTMIRDELSMLITFDSVADLVPFFASSLTFRRQTLTDLIEPLARALVARQESMPMLGLSESQAKFRFLEIHVDSIPFSLLIDIGWCLGFRHQPRSNSWHLAGKAYLLGEMCRNVFQSMHPDALEELVTFNGVINAETDYAVMLGDGDDNIDDPEDNDSVEIQHFENELFLDMF